MTSGDDEKRLLVPARIPSAATTATSAKRLMRIDTHGLAITRFEGPAVQLRPTAPTVNAGAPRPATRTVPRIDWSDLLGVSCSRMLGGALSDVDAGRRGPLGEVWPRRERDSPAPKAPDLDWEALRHVSFSALLGGSLGCGVRLAVGRACLPAGGRRRRARRNGQGACAPRSACRSSRRVAHRGL